MKKVSITLVLVMGYFLFSLGQNEKRLNGINSGMPNRISMNVTVPKQTQGATFGEKVNAGFVEGSCVVVFPNKQAFQINSQGNKVTQLSNSELSKVNAGLHTSASALSQGASLVGGTLPGGSVISAAVSKVEGGTPVWQIKDSANEFLLPSNLTDGEYYLTVVVRSRLKDTLKTQVRFSILVEGSTYKVISANA